MSRLRIVFLLLSLLALFPAVSPAIPPGWYPQINPTGGGAYDIFAFDANTAFAVDTRNIKTNDGGQTWIMRTDVRGALLTVYFLDASNGWCGGWSGIFKTTDGGSTWVQSFSEGPGGYPIESVWFPTSSVGVAVGSIGSQGFLRTIDGGVTWTQLSIWNNGVNRPEDVRFLDAQRGWAVGVNYDSIDTICGPPDGCHTFYVNPKSRVWRTTDGGATWTTTTLASTAILHGVSFVDANNGWIVGDNGVVWKTIDGGASWSPRTSGTSSTLNAVDFVDASNGWAVGSGGCILRSTDRGDTWETQVSGTTLDLAAVDMISATTGWAVGAGIILRTDNGGRCTAALSSTNASIASAGESRTVSITTGSGCSWTAISNDPWISITAGTSGSGSGSVSYTVSANSGASRQGSMEIAGWPFPVVQIGSQDELTFRLLAGATTVGSAGSVDGTGSAARFNHPRGLAVDVSGTIYVADESNHTIRKVSPSGDVTTLAGLAGSPGSVDGTGSDARFNSPSAVAVDGLGNVYVADSANFTIRQVTPAGVVTTLAGLAGASGSTDGIGSAARFLFPQGVAVDTSGNVFVADTDNQTIRKLAPSGEVTTVAGLAGSRGTLDGTGSAARFQSPQGIAVDMSGTIYVADSDNHAIRKVTSSGVVTTLAGLAAYSGSADGNGSAARFKTPGAVAVDDAGNVYVADSGNSTVRRVTTAGDVTTLAGVAGITGTTDGTGSAAQFAFPGGIAVDNSGNVFVGDSYSVVTSPAVVSLGNTIRKVTQAGVVTTLAGPPNNQSADGTGTAARFAYPWGVALDITGNVYVADTNNHTIRKIAMPSGDVTTLAGLAGNEGTVDGTGNGARFNSPEGIAVDNAGNVYVADTYNNTIRTITPSGVVTTLAGTPGVSGSADGIGTAAQFSHPCGLAVDGDGNVYVADTANYFIRKITPAGVVTTFAGGGTDTADGNGRAAWFYWPVGVAVDGSGNVYVADTLNHAIRKITPAGVVTTFAGLVGVQGSADGTGSAARFYQPEGIAVDGNGNVYVADTANNTIRLISPDGLVVTVAGLAGSPGFVDGKWNAARFATPRGVACDRGGNVYVADANNNAIRRSSPFAPPSLASIMPGFGPATGGTPVTIGGSGFIEGALVRFGSTYATAIGVTSTAITATTPVGSGVVDVTVTNPDAQSATLASAFTYTPPPTISSISPVSGPATGGTPVTISGSNFADGATVLFGSAYATGVGVTATTITATTPAGSGIVDVTVTNPDAQSATLPGAFSYDPPPLVTSISPAAGVTNGGTATTIAGANFVSGATASLGDTSAASVVVLNSGTISATTPAHEAGIVNVAVHNPDGQVGLLADAFTYTPWVNGDVNGDSRVGPEDVFYLINAIFAQGPAPVVSGDVNGDSHLDVTDVFYLINYLFAGGPAPQ